MRSKVTFILLALNLALFGYLVVSERPWSATKAIEENRKRVLGPEAANLAAIEITAYAPPAEGAPADAPAVPVETFRLKREAKGDAWFLVAPLDWPANEHAVGPILTALQFLEHETSFPVSDLGRNGQTLADYGLASPRLVVTCTPSSTKVSESPPAEASAKEGSPLAPFTLRIGAGTAIGDRIYVLSPDGRRVHVVAHDRLEALAIDLAHLRSDRLFTIPVFEARALTLQTASVGSARTRLRRDQTRWLFESPITTRAAKTPVELLINDLNALRVARFLPADAALTPEQTGLSTPALRITLEGNSRRETLLLGLPVKKSDAAPSGESTEFYARLDERPTLFTVLVPDAVRKTLDAAQTALRDPLLLNFDPARITAITLSAPLLPDLRIQKLDATATGPAAWQLAAPALAAPLRADSALVERLLRNLQLVKATRFHSDAPSKPELENLGFNRPERTITLQLAPASAGTPVSGPATLVLELALPGGSDPGLYARVQGPPFVYAVPPETLYLFDLAPLSWRDRTLARLPEAAKITRLVLRSTTAPDAAPILDYTPSATPPPPAVATLLAALRELRAKTIVREGHPATVPVDGVEKPWAYTLEATLEPPGDGPLVLTLAERAGGMTQLAGSARLNLVFTLEQPVLDALWTLLYPAGKPQVP